MSLNDGLLLLTGATGFIGLRTLIEALKAGYRVRCAIRAESKASTISSAPAIKSLNLPESALTFAVVPDITVPGAYNEAIRGARWVIHIASPLASQNVEGHKNADEVFLKPAVNGVLEMLKAAKESSTVQKVVITSSAVALMPPAVWGGMKLSDKTYHPESRTANVHGPYETPGVAYCASKIASLNATDDWVARENPDFDVVNVHPSWVLGPADLVKSREEFLRGTNKYLAAVALGKAMEITGDRALTGASVHVDDVALVHVMALDSKIKGYRGFMTSSEIVWDDIAQFTAKHFPGAVNEGLFVADGKQRTAPVKLDSSNTESTFSFELRGLEEQVKDTLSQYERLPEKA